MANTTQPTGNFPWTPDLGNGQFKNPIIFADYSDPDVIRVGDDYWLTASSFNNTPGLPILHSKDLVNWTIVNHALKKLPHSRYDDYQGGCGVWAPAIRFHDNKFWIFYPTPDEGIYVVTATDPRGEWSHPKPVVEGKGLIDPCPFWDDDGKAYLVHAFANSRSGIKHIIRVREMAPDASRVLNDGATVFNDPVNHPTAEGPKIDKWNGYYYISFPAGGVATGWQVIIRSKNIYGPYEQKVVLAQGNSPINGPHQGAIIDTPNGDWWFLHFQERQPYGRIAHLQPVTWKDDWPLMGINQNEKDCGEPVLVYDKPNVGKNYPSQIPQTSDEFNTGKLGLQWQWNANYRDDWHQMTNRPGLRLFSQPAHEKGILFYPHLIAQKFPAPAFTVETRIEIPGFAIGTQCGFAIVGYKQAGFQLSMNPDGQSALHFVVNNEVESTITIKQASARLQIKVKDGGICTFAYATDDQKDFTPIGEPFQATEGHWIGSRVGLYAIGAPSKECYADVDYLRFSA